MQDDKPCALMGMGLFSYTTDKTLKGEMKMNRKLFLCVTAIGFLCLSMTGCQSSQDNSEPTATTPAVAQNETEENTSDTIADAEVITETEAETGIESNDIDTPVIDARNSSEAPEIPTVPPDAVVLEDEVDEDGNLIEPEPETETLKANNEESPEYVYDEEGNVDIDALD
jgi:hypothetical protein